MDYVRGYWFCFAVFGACAAINGIVPISHSGIDIEDVASLVGGFGLLLGSFYGLRNPDSTASPTEPNAGFYLLVLSTLLFATGTALAFV